MSQPPFNVKSEAADTGRGLPTVMLRGGFAIGLAGVIALAMATSAFANGSKPLPSPCASSAPITAPCIPTVGQSGGNYTITLPGIGTLSFTVDQTTGKVTGTPATSALGANFTATIKVDKDTDKISVVFTNSADPTKSVLLVVKTKPGPNGGAPVVTAKVKAVHHDDDGDKNETEHDGGGSGHSGSSGSGHHD
ncbi:MAG: hypothetical protein ACHQ0J_03200 [Candidatus Dormibacterales bacterium]